MSAYQSLAAVAEEQATPAWGIHRPVLLSGRLDSLSFGSIGIFEPANRWPLRLYCKRDAGCFRTEARSSTRVPGHLGYLLTCLSGQNLLDHAYKLGHSGVDVTTYLPSVRM